MEKYIEYVTTRFDEIRVIKQRVGDLNKIPPEVIVAIIDNYDLFSEITSDGIFVTWDVIKALDNPLNQGVVVYFEEIKLYCSTNYDTYKMICDKLHAREYNIPTRKLIESEIKSEVICFEQEHGRKPNVEELNTIKENIISVTERNVNMYQIVLTTNKQKLVFAFNTNDKNIIEKFSALLNRTTNSNPIIQVGKVAEITFNDKLFNNKKESDDFVEHLKTEIGKINIDYSDLISTIRPIILCQDIRYCGYNVNSIILDKPTDEQIAKILKTTLNVNSFIINQHGTINIGSVNTINKPKKSNKDILEDWLKVNPIEGKIDQNEYRQKFFDDTGVKMLPNPFGRAASKYIKSVSGGRCYESRIIN